MPKNLACMGTAPGGLNVTITRSCGVYAQSERTEKLLFLLCAPVHRIDARPSVIRDGTVTLVPSFVYTICIVYTILIRGSDPPLLQNFYLLNCRTLPTDSVDRRVYGDAPKTHTGLL
jgi:hypothetical protein